MFSFHLWGSCWLKNDFCISTETYENKRHIKPRFIQAFQASVAVESRDGVGCLAILWVLYFTYSCDRKQQDFNFASQLIKSNSWLVHYSFRANHGTELALVKVTLYFWHFFYGLRQWTYRQYVRSRCCNYWMHIYNWLFFKNNAKTAAAAKQSYQIQLGFTKTDLTFGAIVRNHPQIIL